MRALNKGWIGIVLVVLFGASLFFFRGSARYSNLFNSDNFVANVSGTPISTSQFLRSLEMNIGQFAQMIGEDLTGDQIRAFQIDQLVLQNLVNNAIFENEFDKLNYILDDSIIAKKTKERFPNLYLNNKINDDALTSFLRQQRLKIEDVVNIIDYETRASVFEKLFFDKNYPSKFSEKINRFNNQTRDIQLLKISYENVKVPDLNESKITKNNKELLSYFENNRLNYLSKEKRDISYLVIDKNSYIDNFIPSNDEISNYFNNNKNIYIIPEKRSFKQFNFKSIEEAENFKISISGLSKDDILAYLSDNDIQFNIFEDLDKNQVLEELSKVIFSLNNNEISDVVTTTLAHHVIILDNIISQKEPSLEEVLSEITMTLTNVQLDNFYSDLKLKINQQILNGYSLNELATENNLSIKLFKDIYRNIEEENDLNLAIKNSAFSHNKDFISDVIEFNNDISFIINVEEIYPSKEQNIDNVYENVLSDFIKSKKIKFAKETFENNKSDNNLQKINSIFGSSIENINVNLRSDDFPGSLLKIIFDAKLDSITFTSDDKNIYFTSVNNINIPAKSDISQKVNLISELKSAFGNEIIKTKNISLNDELIDGLLSQYK